MPALRSEASLREVVLDIECFYLMSCPLEIRFDLALDQLLVKF